MSVDILSGSRGSSSWDPSDELRKVKLERRGSGKFWEDLGDSLPPLFFSVALIECLLYAPCFCSCGDGGDRVRVVSFSWVVTEETS